MKTKLMGLMGLSGVVALMVMGAGCASGGGNVAVGKEKVVLRAAQTNQVAQVATNQVAQVIAKTNDLIEVTPDGFTITRREVTFATNYIGVPVTNYLQVVVPEVAYFSNYVAAPVVTAAKTVGFATNAIGIPFVDAGLTLALAGATTFFAWRNRRNAKKALAEAEGRKYAESGLETAVAVGEVLVDNLEEYRKAMLKIPEAAKYDAQVMKGIQMIQAAKGAAVKSEIAQLVEERTDFTTS